MYVPLSRAFCVVANGRPDKNFDVRQSYKLFTCAFIVRVCAIFVAFIPRVCSLALCLVRFYRSRWWHYCFKSANNLLVLLVRLTRYPFIS